MSSLGRREAWFSSVSLVAVSLALGACSKPQPPQLTPTEAKITSLDSSGLEMRVKMDAFNPNGFALSVRSVVAHVVLEGSQDLGTITSSQPIDLPASARTVLEVPLHVKWEGAVNLASVVASRRPLAYVVDGTAAVGGETLNVDVPFKLQGVITPEQLQQAGLKSLRAIPGLEGLGGLLPK